jgi:hypothetical protein
MEASVFHANLFAPPPPEISRTLDRIPGLIDQTFPLPARFRQALPSDVAELSRLLTSGRGERALSYLGRPNLLSAYLRCFLPWNLYRLSRLLPALDVRLAADDRVTDLGSGPLTLTAALWIARPDLRELPLEFHCIDRSGPALEAGRKLFAALSGGSSPWKIRTVKGGIETLRGASQAALVCAVNVFNETYGGVPHSDEAGLKSRAEKAARLLHSLARETAPLLVVEPGVPQSGRFISLLRAAFIKQNRRPLEPCPHCGGCPCPGGVSRTGKNRWCHFAFETGGAPKALRGLSAAAGLPKERAVLSFLLAGPAAAGPEAAAQGPVLPLRVISGAFPLPRRRFGRYACSERGLVLLAGEQAAVENTAPGALIHAAITGGEERDRRSGALIISPFASHP